MATLAAQIVAALKKRIAEFDQSLLYFENIGESLKGELGDVGGPNEEMAKRISDNQEVLRMLQEGRARAERELAARDALGPYPDPRFIGPDERAFS